MCSPPPPPPILCTRKNTRLPLHTLYRCDSVHMKSTSSRMQKRVRLGHGQHAPSRAGAVHWEGGSCEYGDSMHNLRIETLAEDGGHIEQSTRRHHQSGPLLLPLHTIPPSSVSLQRPSDFQKICWRISQDSDLEAISVSALRCSVAVK